MRNSREKTWSPLGFQRVPASSTRGVGKDLGCPYFHHKPCVWMGFWWSWPKASSCLQDPVAAMAHLSAHCCWISPPGAGCRQSLLCLTGSCDISAACRPQHQVVPPAPHRSAACHLEVSQQNFSHLCTRFGRAKFKLASCYLPHFSFFLFSFSERERHAKCMWVWRVGENCK